MTWLAIFGAVGLLAANAFFVAVEFALLAAPRGALEAKAEAGSRRARRTVAALGDLNAQLAGAQLGITMASLGLGFLAEPSIAHLLEPLFDGLSEGAKHTVASTIAIGIVVFFHMVIGEMVPKNFALVSPERLALWTAPLHRRFVLVCKPFIGLLNLLSNGIVRLFGVEPVDERVSAHTPSELASLLESSAHEGLLDDFEHKLLAGALHLGERTARSMMVPREHVVSVDRRATPAEVEQRVVASGHSRLPVVGARGLDTVAGWIHAKDLLAIDAEQWHRPLPAGSLRPMLAAPADQPLEDVLVTMKRTQRHFALVVSEDGTTAGIITLEDILESVVGDIIDETDRPSPATSVT